MKKIAIALISVGALGACFDFEGTLCADGGQCGEGYYCDTTGHCRHVEEPGQDAGDDDDAGVRPDAGTDAGTLSCSPLGSTEPCGSNTGECIQGVRTCLSTGWGPCSGEVGPVAETCNNLDDDCDTRVDEDDTNQPLRGSELCASPGQGVCNNVARACVNGVFESPCTSVSYGADYEVQEARCDNKDNDCDGTVDETPPAVTLASGVAQFRWIALDGGFAAVFLSGNPLLERVHYQRFDMALQGGAVVRLVDGGVRDLQPTIRPFGETALISWGQGNSDGGASAYVTRVQPDGGSLFWVQAGAQVDITSVRAAPSFAGDAVAVAWTRNPGSEAIVLGPNGAPLTPPQPITNLADLTSITEAIDVAPAGPGFEFVTLTTDFVDAGITLRTRSTTLGSDQVLAEFSVPDTISDLRLKVATQTGQRALAFVDSPSPLRFSVDGGPLEGYPMVSSGDGRGSYDFVPVAGGTYVVVRLPDGTLYGFLRSGPPDGGPVPGGVVATGSFLSGPSLAPVSGGRVGLAYSDDAGVTYGKLLCVPRPFGFSSQ